jgi:polar amino acid transport system substrate-binding protein
LLLAFWIVAVPARADSVQNALSMELAAAKARGCANPADGLDRVLCAGAFRVGVRTGYPGFGVLHGETYSGYDIGVALSIARRLGVRMDPVPVTPANRIEMVSNGAIDAAIATMGYSVARQEQIGFVRPAYYASHTAVIGPRKYQLPDEAALAGKTVCVPLASVANAFLAAKGARLMIFDDPGHLLDALKFGRCTLVAHDDSYFAPIMSDFAFAARFEEKLAVAPLPWGIGVARTGSEALERVLSLIVTDMYRTGALADIAHANHVADGFLTEHQAVWRKPDCILPDGYLHPPVCCSRSRTSTGHPRSHPMSARSKPGRSKPWVSAFRCRCSREATRWRCSARGFATHSFWSPDRSVRLSASPCSSCGAFGHTAYGCRSRPGRWSTCCSPVPSSCC